MAKTQPAALSPLAKQIRGAKIDVVPVHELMPYARNSRTHADWQIAKVAASIKEFGFTNPVLVNDDGTIIAGHARVMAALKLGLEEVPTISLGHLTKSQQRAYVIADNQLAVLADWDDDMLKIELEELKFDGFDITITGFDEIPGISGDGPGGSDDNYTKKIEAPIYEPKGERPLLDDLVDTTKTDSLLDAIDATEIDKDTKAFLRLAAERHNVFNYEKIAEFYAHAPKVLQELMENSALVIIDFNKAIENGFVVLSEKLAEAYKDA